MKLKSYITILRDKNVVSKNAENTKNIFVIDLRQKYGKQASIFEACFLK